jgi:hypothetical protein
MDVPTDVVELVHRALSRTVRAITTSDAEVQELMDLQEEALAAIETVTSLQPVPPGQPAGLPAS